MKKRHPSFFLFPLRALFQRIVGAFNMPKYNSAEIEIMLIFFFFLLLCPIFMEKFLKKIEVNLVSIFFRYTYLAIENY